MLSSYPSIFNFGHAAIKTLTDYPVIIEEKVDGSQFSFMKNDEGVLHFRSKGQELYYDPETGLCNQKMFTSGCRSAYNARDQLLTNYVYRGELLSKPKHNVLAYDRVPEGNVAIFDIQATDGGEFLGPIDKADVAKEAGFEVVPCIDSAMVTSKEQLLSYLDRTSFLGGAKIEGVVIKPLGYNLYGPDKKVLMGKFVSEAFKEVHKGEWRKENPTKNDFIEKMIVEFRTPARWQKALIHLQERGELSSTPRDIPLLLKEVNADILKEHQAELERRAFKYIWGQMSRGVVKGLPEWYKEKLLEEHFND